MAAKATVKKLAPDATGEAATVAIATGDKPPVYLFSVGAKYLPHGMLPRSYSTLLPQLSGDDVAVFDCRNVRDPGSNPALAPKPGTDPEVLEYLAASPSVRAILLEARWALRAGVCNLGFVCSGGRQRSVAIATMLAEQLTKADVPAVVDCWGPIGKVEQAAAAALPDDGEGPEEEEE